MLDYSKYTVQEKIRRKQLSSANMHRQTVKVSWVIKEYYKNVELSANIMHLNNIPFLTSISEHIHYSTARAVNNIKCVKLEGELKNIVRSYAVCDFRVTYIIVNI